MSEEKEESHGVTDERCNWCGGLTQQKVKQLAENVNQLIVNFHKQQDNTAKLFQICLEFLDEEQWPRLSDAAIQRAGGVFKAEKELRIKRKERKQQLIAAVKGYIEMIEKRGGEDVRNQNG